jgi:hypothetical protein
MNRKFLGYIFILVGFCQLSLQLFGLIILQFLDKIKDLNKNPWDYFSEPFITFSFLITVGIVITGLVFISPNDWWKKIYKI